MKQGRGVVADWIVFSLVAMVDVEWVVFGWSLAAAGFVSMVTSRRNSLWLDVVGLTMELWSLSSFWSLVRQPCTRRHTIPSSKFGRPVDA